MNIAALQLLAPGTLLYATKFGSHLYGTDTASSDTDVVGIYLPPLKDVILGTDKRSVVYKSNKSDAKNTSIDVDVTLHSLQYFCELLQSGVAGSIDLLFSMYRTDTQLYADLTTINAFKSISNKLVSKQSKAFIGYALNQAAKYGIKGSHYGDLLEFNEYLNTLPNDLIIADFIATIPDLKYIQARTINDVTYLGVLGKLHTLNLPIAELRRRVLNDLSKYGNRSKAASAAGGVDWKALSHAYRAIAQFEELAETHHLVFPLADRYTIRAIKLNRDSSSLPYYLTIIHDKLTAVQALVETSTLPDSVDKSLLDSIILKAYNV